MDGLYGRTGFKDPRPLTRKDPFVDLRVQIGEPFAEFDLPAIDLY